MNSNCNINWHNKIVNAISKFNTKVNVVSLNQSYTMKVKKNRNKNQRKSLAINVFSTRSISKKNK